MSNISIHIEQGNMFDSYELYFLLWQSRVPPIGLFQCHHFSHRYMTVCKLVLVMTIVVAEILVLLT